MPLSQSQRVTPPIPQDPQLVDFSGIIQTNFQSLFQSGHVHVGINGVLSSAPTKTQGSVGDILIGVVSGSAYLYFKTSATTWFRLGPATAI